VLSSVIFFCIFKHFSVFLFIINYEKMVSKREEVAASVILLSIFLVKNKKAENCVGTQTDSKKAIA